MIMWIFTSIILSKWKCKTKKKNKTREASKLTKALYCHGEASQVQWHNIVKINKHNIAIFFSFTLKSLCLTFQRKYWIQSHFTWSTFFSFFSHHLRKYNYLSPDMLRCYGQHACKGHKTSFYVLILFHLSFVFASSNLLSLRAEDN